MNIGPLRLSPLPAKDDYSNSHLDKGKGYHNRFEECPGRALMFDFEQEIIEKTISKIEYNRYLDFASGTGRILDIIASKADKSYALDVSQSMLNVAKKRHANLSNTSVKFICEDFRDMTDMAGEEKFDLITAFRFFPNAEKKLRFSAMGFLSNLLAKDGIIIMNNHRNFWSVPFVSMRCLFGRSAQRGMNHSEVKKLADDNSLKINDHASLGIVPQTEDFAILGWKITEKIERLNFSYFKNNHYLGYNTVYMLKHAKP